MQVKLLETVKHDGETFEKDDTRTVSKEVGEYFCSNGWAEDVSGAVPTAERDVNRKVLAPDNVFHGHKAGEA